MKEVLLGYDIDVGPIEGLKHDIANAVLTRAEVTKKSQWLACLNVYSFIAAKDDHFFSTALRDADWLVPDGIGFVLASKLMGGGIKSRITGSDVFHHINVWANSVGAISVFFIGSTEDVLEQISHNMKQDYPNVSVVGTYSPSFKKEYTEEEIVEMINKINAAKPDILWVGMSAPKQEKWVYEHRQELNVAFIAAIGAVFDFYAGRFRRSHPMIQKLGLEWVHRLIQQPQRLWRRSLTIPLFIRDLAVTLVVQKCANVRRFFYF